MRVNFLPPKNKKTFFPSFSRLNMAPCTYDCFDSFSRYWLEEAEKIYPHNKSLKKLRDKIQRAKDGLDDILNDDENAEEDVNGNGAANESDDNVAFWCVLALQLQWGSE